MPQIDNWIKLKLWILDSEKFSFYDGPRVRGRVERSPECSQLHLLFLKPPHLALFFVCPTSFSFGQFKSEILKLRKFKISFAFTVLMVVVVELI